MKSRQTFAKIFSYGMRAAVTIAVIAASTSAGAGTNYKVIHNFTGSAASGSFPVGNLVADAAGNFYGVTSQERRYDGLLLLHGLRGHLQAVSDRSRGVGRH